MLLWKEQVLVCDVWNCGLINTKNTMLVLKGKVVIRFTSP